MGEISWSGVRRVVVAAGLMALLAACDSPEERLAKHFESGLELIEENKPRQAILEFRNAVRLNEDHAPSRIELAKLLERIGNYQQAVQHYRVALTLDEQNADIRVRLARIYRSGNAIEEARDIVDEALAIDPDYPPALAVKGTIDLALGNADAAVGYADRAIAMQPDLLEAHMVRIGNFAQKGDLDAALSEVEAEIERGYADDDLRQLYLTRLALLASLDDADGYLEQLRVLVGAFPDTTEYRRELVRVLLATGDQEGAETELRAIADIEPDSTDAALDIVRLVLQTRGFDAAEAELKQLIAASEGDKAGQLRIALAQFYLRTDQGDEARAVLNAMIEDGASADVAHVALARIALGEGRREDAAEHVASVLEDDAENTDALAMRAEMAIEDYNPGAAVADLRLALQSDPDNYRLMLIEARAHERAGNRALRGERLASATVASGYAPEVTATYVDFLLQNDDQTAAESVLSESARRHPGDIGVWTRLADVRIRLQDWAGADQAVRAIQNLEGGQTVANRVTAAALTAQGRFEESTKLLEQADDDTIAAAGVMTNIVANHLRAGRVDAATAFLDEVLEENPENAAALLLRADLHTRSGEVDQAVERLDAAQAANPELPAVYMTKARLLVALGQPDEALAVLEGGLDRTGDAQGLRFMIAQLHEVAQRYDQAIETYESLYNDNADSLLVANNLTSLIIDHQSDDPERLALASRVGQRLQGYEVPHLQDTVGWLKFLTGQEQEAVRYLEAAAEGLPSNPLVRYHLGRAYAATDEPVRAREHLEAALELNPDFLNAESARAVLATLEAQ